MLNKQRMVLNRLSTISSGSAGSKIVVKVCFGIRDTAIVCWRFDAYFTFHLAHINKIFSWDSVNETFHTWEHWILWQNKTYFNFFINLPFQLNIWVCEHQKSFNRSYILSICYSVFETGWIYFIFRDFRSNGVS